MKDFPILYKNKTECCGCTACFSICPVSAIEMIPDEEGFEYPFIHVEKCLICKKCLDVCPIDKTKRKQN